MSVLSGERGYVWRPAREGRAAPGLERVSAPVTPPPPGHVLLRAEAAGLNRADLYQIDGLYPPPEGCDDVPGLETCGIVIAAGEGVSSFAPGDRVCALLPAGGYATHVTVRACHAAAVPGDLPPERAAAAPECYVTALLNIGDVAAVPAGGTLFVHAASGGLGPAFMHVARLRGITPYGVTRDPKKTAFIERAGAEKCYLYNDDYVKAFLKDTGGKGADAVFDCVGADTFSASLKLAAEDGAVVLLGFLSGAFAQASLTRILTKRLRVIGSTVRYLSDARKAELITAFRDSVLPALEDAEALRIDRVFPAEKAEEAVRYMRSCAHTGKIVLRF